METKEKQVIIVSPSLDPKVNVSGVSSVTNFIINSNPETEYIPFQQGKEDKEKGGYHRLLRIFKSYQRWTKVLRKYPEAIIHYNLPIDNKSIIRDFPFINYCKRKRRKIVLHIHGGSGLFAEKRNRIVDWLTRRILTMDCPVIVLSDKEKDLVEQRYKAQSVISLPNAISLDDAATFNRTADTAHLDILFLGRITKEKGMDYILSSLTALKEKGVNFMFHLAGKESEQTYYINAFTTALGKDFRYEGVVYGAGKAALLRQCKIFLLPSYFEGLPMSLLEAMSYGEVPIVTNVGSIGTVVVDHKNGLLVKDHDTDSIVSGMMELATHRDMIATLATEARKTIFDSFNPKRYISNLNRIYDSLRGGVK